MFKPRIDFKNRQTRNTIIKISIVVFCILLLPLIRTPLFTIIKDPAYILGLLRQEISALIFFHHHYWENQRLRKQLGLLRCQLDTLQEAAKENERLRRLLGIKDRLSFKVIPARVIVHYPDNWSSLIVIDKGKKEGVFVGMVTMAYEGLVGRVVEVYPHTSKVALLVDPSFAISGIDQRSRVDGLVSGTLTKNLVMRYLDQDADIVAGDKIVTSGFSPLCPKGIPIAVVVNVADDLRGLRRYAVLKPLAQLDSLEEVLVVIP